MSNSVSIHSNVMNEDDLKKEISSYCTAFNFYFVLQLIAIIVQYSSSIVQVGFFFFLL